MAHRSPARWMAPLALVACAVAAFAVVQGGTSGDGDGSSTAPAATTTSKSTSKAGKGSGSAKRKRTYTVKSGDVLSSIAEAHGTTVEELLSLNPSVNASSLRVGQKLRLPR